MANIKEEHELILDIVTPQLVELGLHSKASYVLISVVLTLPLKYVEGQLGPMILARFKELSMD